MNERRYWLRLGAACFMGGMLLFYLVLNITVKGGRVNMPDLKGLSRSAAEYKLKGLGLHMVVKEERFSSESPYATVLEQDIEAASTIKRGRTVELILSKGTKIVNVPQLAAMTSSRQARLLLEQNGLELAQEDHVVDEAPKDTVLAQAPEAGVEVARGAKVSLLSSLGPPKNAWVMPDFVGGDAAAARAAAQAMGLVLRKVTEKEVKGLAPGKVASQSLSPGARTEEGAELALVVSQGGDSGAPARLAEISYDLPEDGVTERRVLITVTDSLGQRAVYNRMVKPGENVKVEARIHGPASYSVSLGGQVVEGKELP
jgi:beta-lactam-binding protein with PASTA domain